VNAYGGTGRMNNFEGGRKNGKAVFKSNTVFCYLYPFTSLAAYLRIDNGRKGKQKNE
jgi:hypothetical protein